MGESFTIIMKNKFLVYILLFLLNFIYSCSVHKKHYTNGYTIAWNTSKNKPLTNNKYLSTQENKSVTQTLIDSTITKADVLTSATEINTESNTISKPVNYINTYKKLIPNVSTSYKPTINDEPTEEPKARLKYNSKAIISFVMGLIALILVLLLGIVTVLIAPIFGFAAILVVPIFAIIAVLAGKKSLYKIESSPEKYKGKEFAKVGVLLGKMALTLLAISSLILVAIGVSFGLSSLGYFVFIVIAALAIIFFIRYVVNE